MEGNASQLIWNFIIKHNFLRSEQSFTLPIFIGKYINNDNSNYNKNTGCAFVLT